MVCLLAAFRVSHTLTFAPTMRHACIHVSVHPAEGTVSK